MSSTNEVLQQGRYRIDGPSAPHSNPSLYDAYDTVRDTKVLVKEVVTPANGDLTRAQRDRFQLAFANQARTLTSVSHTTLVNVRDFFAEVDRQYVVVDGDPGILLSDLIGDGNRPALHDIARWADQLLDALSYLHNLQSPLFHKQVRPSNIKITPEGNARLFAMGLADVAGAADAEIRYSPLEQIWENLDSASQKVIINSFSEEDERSLLAPLDARSDIYSLGASLYQLLTGRKPMDALERSIEMLDGNPDPLSSPTALDPAVPRSFSDLIMKALEIKRDARFPSAESMRTALRSAVPARNSMPRPEPAASSPIEFSPVPAVDVSPAPPVEPVHVEPVPADVSEPDPQPVAVVEAEIVEAEIVEATEIHIETPEESFGFSYDAPREERRFPMAAVAGAGLLVLIAAVGGFFAFSGGSAPVEPAPVQVQTVPPQPTQPAVTEALPQQTAEIVSPAESAAVPVTETSAAETASQTRRAVVPTAARSPKPEAKPREKTKAITVDDLIRDN